MRRLITLVLLCLCLFPQQAKAAPTVMDVATVQVQAPAQKQPIAVAELKPMEQLAPLKANVSNPCYSGCGYDSYPLQCTRWAALVRERMGNPVGDDWHDAGRWAVNAAAAGVPTGPLPEVGAVMVSTAGYSGHVAVVLDVYPDGSFKITEANYDWAGSIRERVVPNAIGLTFIYN